MTITAETISRTYKCDWCEKEATVTKDIEKLPEKWCDPQGDPPIGEHYCSGECKWEANELWSEAWNVGMSRATDYFDLNRKRFIDGDREHDKFKEDLADIREKLKFLVEELDNKMYEIGNPRYEEAIRELKRKTVDTYNGIYETAD